MKVKKINLSDEATVLWNYYNPSMPFFVGIIGSSDCLSSNDKDYFVERNNSQITAIEYVRKGSGTLEINGKTFRVSEGDVFFVKKNSSHRYYPDKNNLWIKDWIVIDGELSRKMLDWYLPKDVYVQHFNAEYMFSGMRDLLKSYSDNIEEFIKYATLLFCSFIVDLNASLTRNENGVSYQVKNIIDYSSHQNLSIKDIADKLHYSVNYVIRSFKKDLGMTPARYYLKRKIDLAQMYLRTSDETVSEISDKLNFIDQHYFANAFKRETGLTPSRYRAKFRN